MPVFSTSPPDSQKGEDRPISFLLDDPTQGPSQDNFVNLRIRPEELTRADSARVSVQQTLGGAWADNFGRGVPMITLSGHTGWRRDTANEDDGVDRFLALKDQVWDQWFIKRAAAVAAGQDPNGVQLLFSDALDDFTAVCAPLNFTLRRSRSRPLLAMYQITLAVLEDQPGVTLDPGDDEVPADVKQQAGLASLQFSTDYITGAIGSVTSAIKSAQAFINGAILGPIKSFMTQATQIFGQVRAAISAVSGLAGSLISVAQGIAGAGIAVFRSLSAIAQLPHIIKAQFMAVASAFGSIACVLKNALHTQLYYQDYSDVYGASTCSSTSANGRPISSLAGQNPFYSVVPTPTPSPVTMTPAAQSAISSLARTDTVLAPASPAAMLPGLNAIQSGFSVAPV